MTRFLLSWVIFPAILLAAGFGYGWHERSVHYAAQMVAAEGRVVKVTAKQGAVNTTVAVKAQAAQDRIIYRTKTLTRLVNVYVPIAADAHFPLPDGLVRVHDAAAVGADLPDTPAGSPDTASPVAASKLAAVIVSNYGECHADVARLLALQDWVRQQAAAFNSK